MIEQERQGRDGETGDGETGSDRAGEMERQGERE